MDCSKCGRPAISLIRYAGTRLCREHFTHFVDRRVKDELRRQLAVEGTTGIVVGLSGGKDSSVLLMILSNLLGQRPDVGLEAITVDEGIAGYRPPSLEKATALCKELGVEHHVVRFAEAFGRKMDEVVALDGEAIPCSYCGVFRRALLNREARSLGADYLATGLNLDDTAQSLLMNFARNDTERMARMGPHAQVQEGLVPRLQPLRRIPEKEVYLYAMVKGIPFHDGVCPYAERAQRGVFQELLARMEERFPGTRHSILRSHETLQPGLRTAYPPAELGACEECGEPTMLSVCRACALVARLKA